MKKGNSKNSTDDSTEDLKHLHDVARRFELTQRAARVVSWEWDIPNDEIRWSGDASVLYGGPPPRSVAALTEILLPGEHVKVISAVNRAIVEQEDFDVEFQILWPDGSVHWLLGRGEVVYDKKGHALYILGVNVDITERRFAKIERDRFFELSANPFCIVGFDGYFKRVNAAWGRVLGYTTEELLGKSWLEFVHPDDREVARLVAEDFHKRRLDKVIGHESRFCHKDGSDRWLLWSAWTSVTEELLYSVALDITERKLIEIQFHTLANSIPQLAWMSDAKGRLYWFNQRWYDYTGTSLPEVQGWGWKRVHHPDHVEHVVETIQKSMRAGEPWEEKYPLRSKTGEWRWFLTRAIPVRDKSQNIVRWLGTSTDITETLETALRLKAANEALQRANKDLEQARYQAEEANQAKSAFLANISHEIRTPLGVVVGLAELLVDESIPREEREKFVESITRNGGELTRLVEDVLDLSKIESGRIDIDRTSIDLRYLLNDVIETLTPRSIAKGVELRLNIDESVPRRIVSDSMRLRQILLNIVGNALKFTDVGNVLLSVKLEKTNDSQELLFVVKDTGIGLSKKAQKMIFQPFSQADATMTRKYGGSGLGLVLSRKLAAALGGDVVLKESSPGQGSTFVVSIDLEQNPQAQSQSA